MPRPEPATWIPFSHGAPIANKDLTPAQAAAKLQAVITEAINSKVEVTARKTSDNPLTYTLTWPAE